MATPKPRSAQLCSQSGSLASIIACIHRVTLNGWGVLELAHAYSNFESHTVYDFPVISILFLGGLTFLRLPIIVIICHHDHPFSPFSVSSLRCPTVCLPITGSWPHFLLRSFVSHSRHSRHNRHCPRFYPVLSKTNVSNVSLPGVQSCHRVMIFLGVCETTPVISERHDLCNESALCLSHDQ